MKTVLVTGSTSGIGLGIAIEFAKSGYNIAMNGIEKSARELIDDLITKYKVQISYYYADLSDVEQIEKMISEVENDFGSIDILINNAGIQFVSSMKIFPLINGIKLSN